MRSELSQSSVRRVADPIAAGAGRADRPGRPGRPAARSARGAARASLRQALLRTLPLIAALAAVAPAAPAAAAELRIGLALPLAGADAIYGASIREGAELAIADAASGPGGARTRLVVRDDGNDPARAVAVAKALVADGVPVVIGDLSSAAAVAAAAVYAEAGVVDVVPVAAAPALTRRGLATVFRLAARDDAEPASAVRLLLARHIGRVALVSDRTAAGKGFVDAVRTGLARAGVVEVFYGGFEKGSRDLAALAARIKAAGAQVVVFGGGPGDGGQLIRQLRDAGSRATLLGGSALASDEFAAAGGTAADGAMLVFPRDPRSRPAATELLRRLRARGSEPDAFLFYGYAAVQLIGQASAAAKSLAPAAIAAALHAGTFATVLGPIGFDAAGDRAGGPAASDDAVYVWHKGAAGRMALDEQVRF